MPRLLTAPDVASAQPWPADDFPAASAEDDSAGMSHGQQPRAEQCSASVYDAAQPSAASASAVGADADSAPAGPDSPARSSAQQFTWPDRPGVVTMQTLQQLTALWKRRRGQQQQPAASGAGQAMGQPESQPAAPPPSSQEIDDSASFAAASCADDGAAGTLNLGAWIPPLECCSPAAAGVMA